jgi:hypothetical protein
MALEGSQPLKISVPVSAALANNLYTEWANLTGTATQQAYMGVSAAWAQYTLVKINAAGYADVLTAVTDIPIGVIQNRPFQMSLGTAQLGGGAAEIVVIGVTKMRCGTGGFTLNANTIGSVNLIEWTVSTYLVGCGVQAGAATGGSKYIVGQALSGQGLGLAAGALQQQGAPAASASPAVVSGDLFRAVINCVFPLPTGN